MVTDVRMFRSSLGRMFEHLFEQEADIRYRSLMEALGDRANRETFTLLRYVHGMNYDAKGREALRELLAAWEDSGYRLDTKEVFASAGDDEGLLVGVRHLGVLDSFGLSSKELRWAWNRGWVAPYIEAVLSGISPEYAMEVSFCELPFAVDAARLQARELVGAP